MSQVEENLASADRASPASLTAEALELLREIREQYFRLSPIPCTSCGYCMPCQNGVRINHILGLYNDGFIYDDHAKSRFFYRMLPSDQQADNCIECGTCEEQCPQAIPIIEWLQKAHAWLGPRS